jgi:hypothetical protein
MTLTSTSTDDQVYAEYEDNCSYDVNNSVTQCRLFIVACRFLLRREPVRMTADGQSVDFNAAAISKELMQAETWLSLRQQSSSDFSRPGNRQFSLRDIRG